MENITKDLLNTILYEDNGEKSEFHNTIIEGIKPYLKENVILGGGISISFDNDNLDELFNEENELKNNMVQDLKIYKKIC